MLRMNERILLLERMKNSGLALNLTDEYTMSQLSEACDRMMQASFCLKTEDIQNRRLQKEIINNPKFAALYKEVYENIPGYTMQKWLITADELGDEITRYSKEQLLMAARLIGLNVTAQYEYLKYYSRMQLEPEKKEILIDNLKELTSPPYRCRISTFDECQRNLLLEKFFKCFITVTAKDVTILLECLSKNNELQQLCRTFIDLDIDIYLDYERIRNLCWIRPEDITKVKYIFALLGSNKEDMSKFIERWLKNGSMQYDLDWMKKKTELSFADKEVLLETQIGYINMLYGNQLKVPFDQIAGYQTEVLIYAIAHRKKHFLCLVSEHFEEFSKLGYDAMLFDRAFYERCNLNSLTLANLKECNGDWRKKTHILLLSEGKYTFAELKTLWYASPPYIELYNRLHIQRADDRLIVIRQLLKRDMLSQSLKVQEIEILAQRLSQKPLSKWYVDHFSHIHGISLAETLHFLLEYDKLERFLRDMSSKEEILYAIRNVEAFKEYESWVKAREDILILDQDFAKLREYLNLSDAFVEENRSYIQYFLLSEGAEMSRIYYEYTAQKEAFRRIVVAELMGKLQQVKYHEEDLEKEISYPISKSQKDAWQKNRQRIAEGMEINETDDFYSTLRIGTLPHRTCLSYLDGMHRDCVLAGFDSNKKMLLASKGGRVVGRAVIRLTKGSSISPEDQLRNENKLEFADLLSKETEIQIEKDIAEDLVLFLEKPYFAYISEEEQEIVKQLFVELISEKAEELNAVAVLANAYYQSAMYENFVRQGYYLYISRSKSGVQYLDSLSGEAGTSTEGSYKVNTLLVQHRK